jgi:hypothetical protein
MLVDAVQAKPDFSVRLHQFLDAVHPALLQPGEGTGDRGPGSLEWRADGAQNSVTGTNVGGKEHGNTNQNSC